MVLSMVAQIVGNYLVERGLVTRGQMLVVHKERQKVRANLGLVAVSEGYMSSEEAKQIYEEFQTTEGPCDRAFAEVAEERAYMTGGQIRMLAYKQSDSYLCFAQALEKLKIMTFETLNEVLDDFPLATNEMQLDDLKSNDISRIVPLFLPPEAKEYVNAACCALQFLNQKIDANIFPLKAYIADTFAAANGVYQFAKGEKEYAYAIVARNEEMATLATCYMRERYDGIDEEILDIISEIVSKISATYATELSQDGVLVDLMPAKSYTEMKEVKSEGMLVFELSVKYETFYLLICVSNEVLIY
jgi:CheY-specific phosphatase CheX